MQSHYYYSSAISFGKIFGVWTGESVVGSPTVPLIFHEEEEAASGMGKVGVSCLGIIILSSPPGEEMSTECGKVAPPFGSPTPVIRTILSSTVAENVSDVSNSLPRDEIKASLFHS